MNCKWCALGECWTHPGAFWPAACTHAEMEAMWAMWQSQAQYCKWCELGECWVHPPVCQPVAATWAPYAPYATAAPRPSTTVFVKAFDANCKFGFRGDSLILTRSEGTRTRKYKHFKAEVEAAFGTAFRQPCVDYQSTAGGKVREVTAAIQRGPHFEVLCVGLGCNDLMDLKTEKVLPVYPARLDDDLCDLVAAVQEKSNNHLFLLAGHSSIWQYPPVWDEHIAHLQETLEGAGAVVVPPDEGTAVMQQMPLNSDGMHFLHDDDGKQIFAEAWVQWLVEFAGVGQDDAEAAEVADAADVSVEAAETLCNDGAADATAGPGKAEARGRSRSRSPLR